MKPMPDTRDYNRIEAIDLARGQLDFGALASTTPSVKTILLKAQTMGPLAAKPSPLKITAASAVAVGVLGAACLPWIPLKDSLAVVEAGFERALTEDEAYKLVSRLTREFEPNVLVGSRFSPEADGCGRLRLSFTGTGTTPERIQRDAAEHIAAAASGLEPLFTVEVDERRSTTTSPLLLALSRINPPEHPVEASETLAKVQGPAESVLASASLLEKALQRRFAATQRGITLEELRFLPRGQTAGDAGMDFLVEAWPLNLGFNVRDFSSYTVADQEFILHLAQEFVAGCGIEGGESAAVVPAPLRVSVLRADGSHDAYLTRLLTAFLVQPTELELGSANYDPKAAVEQACERLMPGQPVLISFTDPGRQGRAGLRHYEATVQLCSSADLERERRVGGLGSRSVDEAETTEDPERDW